MGEREIDVLDPGLLAVLRVELYVVAELLAEVGLKFLVMLHAVDDSLLDRLLRRVQCAVDPLADFFRLYAASLGNRLLITVVEAVQEPVSHSSAASGLGPFRINISAVLLYLPQVRKSGFTEIASSRPRT